MKKLRIYDNTTLSTIKMCMAKGAYSFKNHWRPDKADLAMEFGDCYHCGMQGMFSAFQTGERNPKVLRDTAYETFLHRWVELGHPNPVPLAMEDEMLPRTPGVALEIFTNFLAKKWDWMQTIEVIAVEKPFAVPLDPDDPTLFYVGRWDLLIKEQVKKIGWVNEHKTSSLYSKASGIQTRWADGFDPDAQTDGYFYSATLTYPDITWGGVYINGALVHKSIHDVFPVLPFVKTKATIAAWYKDTMYTIRRWEEALELGYFPRNTESCIDRYSKVCMHRSSCLTHNGYSEDAQLPPNLVVKPWAPFALEGIQAILREKGFEV